jgi:hypothetical protein
MLLITCIDVKIGKILQMTDPETGTLQPQQKRVEHSYLEAWLTLHQIEGSSFYVGDFYSGVNDYDRQRLESEDKFLVFSNGKKGYFTDAVTAALVVHGDQERGIQPIYAHDVNSPHNFVAYGSLITSDGLCSTLKTQSRILVVDDEARSIGKERLISVDGQPVSDEDLQRILDKMGDGTMLVTADLLRSLLTPAEIANNQKNLNHLVTQFRAASPDFPGMAKGTLATSLWCEFLGVDAIVAQNDIKGDDGQFTEPGIKTVSAFWVNRKADAVYGEQSVGPQVKGCIPEATWHELNPLLKQKAVSLAAVASDPLRLMQYYVTKKTKQAQYRDFEAEPIDADTPSQVRQDWLKELAIADRYGQLVGFKKVNHELEQFLKGERKDLALHGIEIPSAMAQHHNALKPWEIAQADLPHGAIVVYYRSPFPNVGAAAIAINNARGLRWAEAEAYDKAGVIYLNPWTAKHIAITDFDGDINGCFVGFTATDTAHPQGLGSKLPDWLRTELAWTESLPLSEQYEAGRALIAQMIEQVYHDPSQAQIRPAQFPQVVTEVVQRNAPDRKPPEIVKAQKVKHPWHPENESHAQATWRAWSITANNPTGMVANAGMILQSLALETQYIAPDRKLALLQEISTHHQNLLKQIQQGKLSIPSDTSLQQQGLPPYHIQSRIIAIAQANQRLQHMTDPITRHAFVETSLAQVNSLLNDMVEGPNAMNLQTAVDTAKSSRGIDQEIQTLMRALAHREHQLRLHHKHPAIYTQGKVMPTNTQEPIGWAVETANALYVESSLPELKHETFRDLFPSHAYTPHQQERAMEIARAYNTMVQEALAQDDRRRQKHRADQQPTATITTTKGNIIHIQRLLDVNGHEQSPIWRNHGLQPDWIVEIDHNPQISQRSPELLIAKIITLTETLAIGFVTPESTNQHNLTARLKNSPIQLAAPTIVVHPPLAIQHDTDTQLRSARLYLEQAIQQIPASERMAYATALWHQHEGMGIVLKEFLPELSQQLQQLPQFTLTGLQHHVNQVELLADGDYKIFFTTHSYEKEGTLRTNPAIGIINDIGDIKTLGVIDPRSLRLPTGTIAQAHITIPLADQLKATVNDEVLTIKQLNQYELANLSWQGESAQLIITPGKNSLDWVAQVEMAGAWRTLGKVDRQTAQLFPPGQSITATLTRERGTIAQVQVLEVMSYSTEETNTHRSTRHHPSRAELREWYLAVQANSHDYNQTLMLGQIEQLGRRLNNAYCEETGQPQAAPGQPAIVPTPMDYRSPQVFLDADNLMTMQAAIETVQNFRETVDIER